MGKKLYIKTMGCQMNEYDSDKMADVLRESHGYELTTDADEADLLLVNTCSIREKAQEKVFSELGRWRPLKEKRRGVMIGVGGCVASQEGEGITRRAPFVDVVFGHRLCIASRSSSKTLALRTNRSSIFHFPRSRSLIDCPSHAPTARPRLCQSWRAAASTAVFALCHTHAVKKSAARWMM